MGKNRNRRAWPLLLALTLSPIAFGQTFGGIYPTRGHFTGGGAVAISRYYPLPLWSVGQTATVWFGDVPSPEVWTVLFFDEYQLYCTVPEHAPGTVDVTVTYEHATNPYPTDHFPSAFTYLKKSEISEIAPSELSYKSDQRQCRITGTGFSLQPGVKVYFGDNLANDVQVEYAQYEDAITCQPPQFPGGPWPLSVDVRIVNPSGDFAVLMDGVTYTQIVPKIEFISPSYIPAWKFGMNATAHVSYFVQGQVLVFVNNILTGSFVSTGEPGRNMVRLLPPPSPPGWASVTLINGDGGRFTLEHAIEYYGPEYADFHTADLDQDFRFSISEVLRVVQLYNVGAFHCDGSSEDGFAPGTGDDTCAPHAADTAPQDWQVSLSELLAVIQLYNSLCYQPCPDAPGTYCPPDSLLD